MSLRPLCFTAFCSGVLKVELTPGQHVIGCVAYDGVDPCDLAADERALARQIFGDIDRVPPGARSVFVATCGRGAGKSYILCALRALHLALTVPLPRLAPGEVGVAIIVAPDLRLARQTLSFVAGAVDRRPAIRSLVQSQTADRIELLRPNDGVRVAIECLPATARGSALRGRTVIVAVLDEGAFFRDAETGAINDVEVYRALQPRVVPGGQTILASTPWSETGLLHELFKANHGKPETALAAHAPTLLLQDTAEMRAVVEREEKRDPLNARREFGAEFTNANSSAFFDANAIAAATEERIDPLPPHEWAAVGIGADFGFRSDSSALVVVQNDGELLRVADVIELQPSSDAPLQPSAVVRAFAKRVKHFGARFLLADGHYQEAIRETLHAHRLALVAAPEGASGKLDVYTRARALLHEGKVKLPNHERLRRQLREVTARPLSGGGLSIQSPRWARGGHGDLASAFVLAVYQAAQYRPRPPIQRPAPGSPEAINAEMEEYKNRLCKQIARRQRDEFNHDPIGYMRRKWGMRPGR